MAINSNQLYITQVRINQRISLIQIGNIQLTKELFEGMEDIAQMYHKPILPTDEQGFTKSFNLHNFDPQQAGLFFKEFGIIIFNGVIDEIAIEKTIDDIWTDIQAKCGQQCNRHDESTWKFQKWRGKYGFVNGAPLRYPQICLNRQNANVYKAFKTMYQLTSGKAVDEPLIASFDRASSLRPGFNHPEWVIHDIYHFDIKPWWWTQRIKTTRKDWRGINDYVPDKFAKWLSEGNNTPFNGYTKLAGVLALTDTNQTSGGFQCVCGFQNWIHKWCQVTEPNTQISQDQNLMNLFQKVFQRKGSLLIFTRELPHNIYKNVSSRWRYAQYLRMSPLSSLMLTEFEIKKRRQCVINFLPKDLKVDDPISREIYMLE